MNLLIDIFYDEHRAKLGTVDFVVHTRSTFDMHQLELVHDCDGTFKCRYFPFAIPKSQDIAKVKLN